MYRATTFNKAYANSTRPSQHMTISARHSRLLQMFCVMHPEYTINEINEDFVYAVLSGVLSVYRVYEAASIASQLDIWPNNRHNNALDFVIEYRQLLKAKSRRYTQRISTCKLCSAYWAREYIKDSGVRSENLTFDIIADLETKNIPKVMERLSFIDAMLK